jgi:hypothetical protein
MSSSASVAIIEQEDLHNNDLAKVRAAVEAGADVNAPAYFPPLHVAAFHGYEKLAQYLVEKGAHIDMRSEQYGVPPLEEAARAGNFNLALWLLNATVTPSQDYLERTFRAGLAGVEASFGKKKKQEHAFTLANRAVELGLPRDSTCVRWAVHMSAIEGTTVMLRWLDNVIKANLDDRGDKRDFGPPIVDAVRHGHVATVRYLIERGVSPNKENGGPLFAAVGTGDPERVAFLLKQGAKPDVRNAEGHTPMFYASFADCEPVMNVLAAAGEKLDASEEADLSARRAEWERLEQEKKDRWAAQDRRRLLINLAIKIPVLLLWALYLVAAIVWHENATMWNLNLVVGPIFGAVGAGLVAGIWFTTKFSSGRGGIPQIANGVPVGAAVALVTLVVLAILSWHGRADMATHPWFYYVGPILSGGIPRTVSILSFGK